MNHLNFSEQRVYIELEKRKRNKKFSENNYRIGIQEFTYQLNNFKSIKRRQWIEEQSKKNIPFYLKVLFNLACINYDDYVEYIYNESKKINHISYDLF